MSTISNQIDPSKTPFSSNAVRLSPRQWLAALAVVGVLAGFTPVAWERIEPLPAGPDARVPYRLGNDYWAYGRYCRWAAKGSAIVVLGDSVVWGHYVSPQESLPACLNKLSGAARFVNLGLDGIHPAAAAGLFEYYGGSIAGKKVVLHCNLLWMSSKRHDLQTDKEFAFNHPLLVPQFRPRIPCYRESLSGRIGACVGREVPFLSWLRHVQIAYFDGSDLPGWMLEHPYDCPAKPVNLRLPSPDEPISPPPGTEPWTRRHMPRLKADWVELDGSFQWQSFLRTLDLLKGRGNEVFVVVGPFNEPMLADASRDVYKLRKQEVHEQLAARQIPHVVAAPLPSELYADASHPLADGYALMALQLSADPAFAEFCGLKATERSR